MAQFLFPGVPSIIYEDMAAIEDFATLEHDKGQGVKIPLADPRSILFRWTMEEGSVWGTYKHPRAKGIIKIMSGKFLYRGVECGPGRIIHIHAGVPHRLDTIESGVFYVEFIKPK